MKNVRPFPAYVKVAKSKKVFSLKNERKSQKTKLWLSPILFSFLFEIGTKLKMFSEV